MTTIAVAQRATVTAVTAPARGAREEDDAVGVTRDLVEVRHHLGLPAAALGLHRDRGPHAQFQLLPEFRDETLFVLGRVGSPSAISCSPYPGRIRRNFMRALCHVRWGAFEGVVAPG